MRFTVSNREYEAGVNTERRGWRTRVGGRPAAACLAPKTAPQPADSRPAAGFTLLELVLALALSVVILMAVGMAIDVHLHSFYARRAVLEEAQLARAILRILSEDIRRVAVHYEQDLSGLEAMLQSGGRGGGGGSSSDGDTAGQEEAANLGTEDPIDAGGTAAAGAAGSSGAASTNTQGLAELAALPATPGIFGNQYELQIDVSRLPRVDQYQPFAPEDVGAVMPTIPSDIKTVTYFVQTNIDPATAAVLDPLAAAQDPANASGLVRRELDRAIAQWAMSNGNAAVLMQGGELLAPEVVAIEFQYFDGIQWRLEWDSQVEQSLPLAIQIVLAMRPPDPTADDVSPLLTRAATQDQIVHYYRLVVHLPVGMPTETTESTTQATATL